MLKRRFRRCLCWNQVKYARITITHVCFIALTLAGSLGRYLNTRPSGLVFKQLPRDPANVNAWKNMCDPYIHLSELQTFQKFLDWLSEYSTSSSGNASSFSSISSSRRTVSRVLLDFSLTVKAATLIFIFWRGSAISSAKEGESGFIYNLVKS